MGWASACKRLQPRRGGNQSQRGILRGTLQIRRSSPAALMQSRWRQWTSRHSCPLGNTASKPTRDPQRHRAGDVHPVSQTNRTPIPTLPDSGHGGNVPHRRGPPDGTLRRAQARGSPRQAAVPSLKTGVNITQQHRPRNSICGNSRGTSCIAQLPQTARNFGSIRIPSSLPNHRAASLPPQLRTRIDTVLLAL